MRRPLLVTFSAVLLLGAGSVCCKERGAEVDSTPSVLFDEAHFNTAGFTPLAELLTRDGYRVVHNRKRFSRDLLRGYDILFIPGALPTGTHNSVAFSPDGKTVASGGSNRTIKQWDVRTGKVTATLKNTDWIGPLAFSHDGSTLASVSHHDSIRLWDVKTGTERTLLEGHIGTIQSVVFSPDGRTLASSGENQTVEVWDLVTERPRLLRGHVGVVHSLAFSPGGKTLASGGSDGRITLWDVDTGQKRTSLEGNGTVWSVAFSPDGKVLASARDEIVELWDVATAQVRVSLEGHSGEGTPLPVHSVAFSPDGRMLASGGGDETIKVWDTGTGHLQATLEGHNDVIRSVAFSPDGKTLASVDDDEVLKVWRTWRAQHTITDRVDFVWHPGSAFTEEECDAVRDWVHAGGGLLLLADHAPYAGAAESLAGRFAVTIVNSRGTLDPSHHSENAEANEGFLVFTRDTGLLRDHPVTRGRNTKERISRVLTYYGTSLQGPDGSTAFLALSPSAVDRVEGTERVSAAGRAQGVALAFGKGRVVVLGEMGLFVEDATHLNGSKRQIGLAGNYDNRQLALNIVHWLSAAPEPSSVPSMTVLDQRK